MQSTRYLMYIFNIILSPHPLFIFISPVCYMSCLNMPDLINIIARLDLVEILKHQARFWIRKTVTKPFYPGEKTSLLSMNLSYSFLNPFFIPQLSLKVKSRFNEVHTGTLVFGCWILRHGAKPPPLTPRTTRFCSPVSSRGRAASFHTGQLISLRASETSTRFVCFL
jgi:hypothetical protein